MTDNQTHPVDAAKPPLFDKVIATVNASSKIQGLLYDLGLLPEQTSTDPLNWARTGSIALEIAERDERIRKLEHEVRDANAIIAAAVSAELRADNTRLQNEVVMPLRERIKVLEDLLWTLAEHNELHFGKSHSTVIQCRAALGDKT